MMNTVIYLLKFKITPRDPCISIEVAWAAHKEPTPSRISFNRFPHFTSSCVFSCGGGATFTNFSMAHHNLESSRATPSHLGGFTCKSNKYHEDCFTNLKCSSAHKEDLAQPSLGFLTNQPNLTKRCRGELTKAYGCAFSLVEPTVSKGGRRKAFILSFKN
jgi:hypothetical protein